MRAIKITAKDIMSRRIASVPPNTSCRMAAQTMLKRRVSALLVLDSKRRLLGIITEGDLVHRAELGTRKKGSWWLNLLTPDRDLARSYAKAHGRKVADAMSRNVVSVSSDTKIPNIVALLDEHRIKRLPVLDGDGKAIGVVSRADILAAFVSSALGKGSDAPLSDAAASAEIRRRLNAESWSDMALVNVSVERGVAKVRGVCAMPAVYDAVRTLCEDVPGIRHVDLSGFKEARAALKAR